MELNSLTKAVGVTPIKIGASAHEGASHTSLDLGDWFPAAGSPDADLIPELESLNPRSRDLIRNNGLASSAVRTQTDSVVGIGLRVQAAPNYRALGWANDQAAEWAKEVEAQWLTWAESKFCDASRIDNFYQLTRLVYQSLFTNGGALALPVWLPEKQKHPWSTALNVIEVDRLSNPSDQPDSEKIRGGIEVNKYGAPLAYHVRKTHPGDMYWGFGGGMGEWERVEAETKWGRARVLHIFDRERPGQQRGKPDLTPIMTKLKNLDRFDKVYLRTVIVDSLTSAFIESSMPWEDVQGLFTEEDDPTLAYLEARNQNRVKLSGGAVGRLFPGDKLTAFNTGRPSGTYTPFMEGSIRNIAAGLNMPYELLYKDFSKTNYSSARAALLEAWRFFMTRRSLLTFRWVRPVYELWFEEAVNSKAIEAPDFYANREAYTRIRVIGPGRGWVDPLKEAQAAEKRMDAGLSSLQQECAEQGLDWEENLDQRAREKQALKDRGLLEQANAQATRPVLPSATDEPEEEDEDDKKEEAA